MTDKTEAQRLADLIRPTVPCQHRSEAADLLLKQEAALTTQREAMERVKAEAEVMGGGFAGWIIETLDAALTATEGL